MVGIILWGLFIEEGCPIVGLIENFNSFYIYDANQYIGNSALQGSIPCMHFLPKFSSGKNLIGEQSADSAEQPAVRESDLLLSHFAPPLGTFPPFSFPCAPPHAPPCPPPWPPSCPLFFRTNAQIYIRKGSSIFKASPFEESLNATKWWSNDCTHLLWGRRSWGRLRRHNSVAAQCK